MIILVVIGISLFMTALAVMCCIPGEELRRARNKREFDKAVKELNNPTSYKGVIPMVVNKGGVKMNRPYRVTAYLPNRTEPCLIRRFHYSNNATALAISLERTGHQVFVEYLRESK